MPSSRRHFFALRFGLNILKTTLSFDIGKTNSVNYGNAQVQEDPYGRQCDGKIVYSLHFRREPR
jgi:hypothetical protein